MLEALVVSFVSFLNFLLALSVFLRNRKDRVNQLFSLMVTSIVCWTVFNFFANKQNDFALLSTKLTLTSGISVAVFLFLFVIYFFKIKVSAFIKVVALFLGLIISLIIMFTPLFVTGIHNTQYGTGVDYGRLSFFYFISIIFYILSSVALAIISFAKTSGKNRLQAKYLLYGVLSSLLLGSITNIIIPLLLKTQEFAQLGPITSFIFISFTSYSIAKHRLMDIRMVVARSVAYLVLLASLAGIYVGAVLGLERIFFPQVASQFNLVQGALRTAISVIMVFLFQPLKKWITKATDSIFFKNQYDPQTLLDTLSHTVSSSIVLIEMLYKVNDILINEMKLSRCAFILLKSDFSLYNCQAVGYKGCPQIDDKDFAHFAKKDILIYDELEDSSHSKKLLRKYSASISMPLKTENEIVGVFLAGEKNSGDMFSQQDLKILNIFAPEVSVAIENAKAYEEISRFNVTLRQEVKRATHRLKEKNEQLKELDKAKDEFISMASHQLRTPLTAIKGYLSMLLEGDAGEIKVSQYDFINEAYSAAGRMVGLINDLLNVSRMETGRFFLEPKEVDIERIVEEEVKQLQNHAKEKGIYVKIVKKGKVPAIWADETKIRQVVMNFIDNAIYYTTNGGVTVHLTKDKNDFIFEVVDTGIGVPKEQQKHLFEKFFRADNARQTRPDGTGLGIYLARKVTEDHGGKVIFHSEEGKGSTFGFKFPLKARIPQKMQTAPSPRPSAPVLTSASTLMSSDPALDAHGPILEPTLPPK